MKNEWERFIPGAIAFAAVCLMFPWILVLVVLGFIFYVLSEKY